MIFSIVKVKVKVMHMLTGYIYKIVTDWTNVNVAIGNTYEVAYGLSISIFRSDFGRF